MPSAACCVGILAGTRSLDLPRLRANALRRERSACETALVRREPEHLVFAQYSLSVWYHRAPRTSSGQPFAQQLRPDLGRSRRTMAPKRKSESASRPRKKKDKVGERAAANDATQDAAENAEPNAGLGDETVNAGPSGPTARREDMADIARRCSSCSNTACGSASLRAAFRKAGLPFESEPSRESHQLCICFQHCQH